MKIFKTVAALALVTGLLVAAGAQSPKRHKVSPAQASKIALKKYPGKLAKGARLEHEDGRWQYEVLIKKGKLLLEVNVDADSGKIASVEKTSAREEAREKKKKGE